ncbi:hypothetical protein DYY67_1011 [Candidatus Nitrosotalea sp. TS]|nr:hypothetical protein [Candidatus Nitrosotalea sp. TS]
MSISGFIFSDELSVFYALQYFVVSISLSHSIDKKPSRIGDE